MYGLLIALHLIICCALIISVLLQSAKGEGLAGAFGGSSLTGTVFGGRGAATFLSKATTVLAIAFFSSALVLGFMRPAVGTRAVSGGESAVEEAARQAPAPVEQPVTQDQPQGQPAQQPSGQEATPIDQLNPETPQQTPPGDSGKR
ncbi:MAG: preprotein translocase subunit SecG [Candidatus Zixiibacteriota bacterium]